MLVEHKAAQELISQERQILSQLKELPDTTAAASAGISYLKYLTDTWMPPSLWHGWSQKGRIEASVILKIPIEGVIPTTNHLEAFNGILKRKHVHRWQHASKRLRFDLFVYLLITQILPGIFNHRSAQENYRAWLADRFRAQAGGVDLVATRKHPAAQAKEVIPVAWWSRESQERYAEEASYIAAHGRLADIRWINIDTVVGTCASSTVDIRTPGHLRYKLQMSTYGWATCSCPRFKSNSGACKHLWALRIRIPQLITTNMLYPSFYQFIFPVLQVEARRIYVRYFGEVPNTAQPENIAPSTVQEPTIPPFDVSGMAHITNVSNQVNDWLDYTAEVADIESAKSALSDSGGELNSGDESDDAENTMV